MSGDQLEGLESENIFTSELVLPDGETVQEIRETMPSDSQLLMKLKRTKPGQEDDKRDVVIDDSERKYQLKVGQWYVVGRGPKDNGEVYLNLLGSTELPADISLRADGIMANANWRGENGQLEVRLSSDDANLLTVQREVLERKMAYQTFLQVRKEWSSLGSKKDEIIAQMFKETGLNEYHIPSTAGRIVESQAGEAVCDTAVMLRVEGHGADLIDMWSNECKLFLEGVKRVVDRRVVEARSAVLSRNEMFVALDQYPSMIDGLPYTVMTVFRPGLGWSVLVPLMDCPQQVASLLKDVFAGKLSEDLFPVFAASVKRAKKKGILVLDNKNFSLVYRAAGSLNLTRAVFHGDEGLKPAMEVVRMVGDPWDGEWVFHQIVVSHDERELKEDLNPEIVIKKIDLAN